MGNTSPENESLQRRPIASRNSAWAPRVAAWLTRRGATPNGISLMSIALAAAAGACILAPTFWRGESWRWLCFPLAVGFILGRLLCNLFDGMVAVEGNQKSPAGEVFNDLPDRVSDAIIFISLGYAAMGTFPHAIELGYLTALLATITAYIRLLGASMGLGHCFCGPMAKQHRMAVTMLALLAEPAAALFIQGDMVLGGCLGVIALGTLFTSVRRLRWIFRIVNKA
jgi:phosphatidylglycerophosphate synthase